MARNQDDGEIAVLQPVLVLIRVEVVVQERKRIPEAFRIGRIDDIAVLDADLSQRIAGSDVSSGAR
jgi:hypothetical protein